MSSGPAWATSLKKQGGKVIPALGALKVVK